MKIKLKTFDEAMRAAIRLGFETDIYAFSDDKIDSIYGIMPSWIGWGNAIEARYCSDYGAHRCYFGEDCFIPFYCIRSIVDERTDS